VVQFEKLLIHAGALARRRRDSFDLHVRASPLESASTLRSIVEIIRSIMQADVASIMGFELEDETVSWKAAAGFRSQDIDYEETYRRPQSISPSEIGVNIQGHWSIAGESLSELRLQVVRRM
jgi:hypothetical protein